jgi:hypothetical protein
MHARTQVLRVVMGLALLALDRLPPSIAADAQVRAAGRPGSPLTLWWWCAPWRLVLPVFGLAGRAA